MNRKLLIVLAVLCISLTSQLVYAAGEIYGLVVDAETGNAMAGTNVFLKGTSFGAAADIDGEYRITAIPAGTYTVVASYMGYEVSEKDVFIREGQSLKQDFELIFETIKGEAVTVTAQREGQLAAINQQLTSNTIVNVVSQERIRELPDDNAAESVGRLPGVSVRRSGGEGQRVNIRGLSPKFNSITINGERIPATGQGRRLFYFKGAGGGSVSTTTEDRSVDLSVVSSEALQGIEVFKALTPEQDADAIGGAVNFKTGKVPSKLKVRVNALGGYTGYHNSFENAKLNATVSNRYLDDKLGMLISAGFQRADRSRDSQSANWILRGAALQLGSVDLNDTKELRDRYSANLNLDYSIGKNTTLLWSNMFSRTNREVINRNFNMSLTGNDADYGVSWSKPSIYVISSNLRGEHETPFADIDWGVSYISTVDGNDFNYGHGFQQQAIFQSTSFVEEEGPYAASNNVSVNPSLASGGTPWGGGTNERKDNNVAANLNFKRSFSLGSNFFGYVKMGGKYRTKERTLKTTGLSGRGSVFTSRYIADNPELALYQEAPAMSNYIGAYDPGDFFFGDHYFPTTLDYELPYNLFRQYRDIWRDSPTNGINDYTAKEKVAAGYLQTELSYKQRITLIAGARYEHIQNDYVAVKRTDISIDNVSNTIRTGTFYDTTSTEKYGEWFPQFHLKFKILQDEFTSQGLDLRLAYTRSISRPDYLLISPRYYQSNSKRTIERGVPDLKPTISWNYDAFLTLYSKVGMITLGGFYKDLENVSFEYVRQALPERDGVDSRWIVVDPINSNEDNKVYGLEIELQPSLNWLPSPFDGIILYGNYSLIHSEVHYPWTFYQYDPTTYKNVRIDSTRKNQLPGQANNIFNISLGYEKGKFSGRFSYFFQDKTLDWIGENDLIDGWVDSYSKLDFSGSYKWNDMLTILLTVNNILNRTDRSFLGIENRTGSESVYGTRAEFGVRLDL